jgi:hypothetical protein
VKSEEFASALHFFADFLACFKNNAYLCTVQIIRGRKKPPKQGGIFIA